MVRKIWESKKYTKFITNTDLLTFTAATNISWAIFRLSSLQAAVYVDQFTEKHIVVEPIDGPTSGVDIHVDSSIFSTGKSPLQGSSGAGGLARGTPEVGVST